MSCRLDNSQITVNHITILKSRNFRKLIFAGVRIGRKRFDCEMNGSESTYLLHPGLCGQASWCKVRWIPRTYEFTMHSSTGSITNLWPGSLTPLIGPGGAIT